MEPNHCSSMVVSSPGKAQPVTTTVALYLTVLLIVPRYSRMNHVGRHAPKSYAKGGARASKVF